MEKDYIKNKPGIFDANGHDYVEIGGLKWATMNIGASSITDGGLYFQWGDTQGYTAEQAGSGEGKKHFELDDYKYYDFENEVYTKYNSTDNLITLQPSDDAVTAAWGGSWRMPTIEELEALFNSVNIEQVSNYQGTNISGLVATDKTDSNKTLFFPHTIEYIDGTSITSGWTVSIWSKTNSSYNDS
jgi:hypothetical protein